MFFGLYGPNGRPVLDFVHALADFAEGERTEHERNVDVTAAKRSSLVFSKFPTPRHPEVSTNTQLKHKFIL